MKPSPGTAFDAQLISASRDVTYKVYFEIDGVETDVSDSVKNVQTSRSAGDSKVSTFTGSLSSEATIVISPAEFDFGANPMRNRVRVLVGFAGSNVQIFSGLIQRIQKKSSGEAIVTCLDEALALTRISVETPALFNVYSTEYMKEILENAGFTARMAPPSSTIFAADFDVSANAVVSAEKKVSSTQDNGVNLSTIKPSKGLDLNLKKYYYRESERSFALHIQPSTITHPTTSAGSQSSEITDPAFVIPPTNATGRAYLPMPSGYGGGAVTNPTVLYFPSTQWGYKYYMTGHCNPESELSEFTKQLWRDNGCSGVLGFAERIGFRGDPSVLVSSDGDSFSTAPWDNPIATVPTYPVDTVVKKYNSTTKQYDNYTIAAGENVLGVINTDPTLYWSAGTLYCIWTQITKSYQYWYYASTVDGISWSAPVLWVTFAVGQGMSPSFASDADGNLHVWWISFEAASTVVRHSLISGSIGSTILELNRGDNIAELCTFSVNGSNIGSVGFSRLAVTPCHSGVGFDAILTICQYGTIGANPRIHFASSFDGRSWNTGSRPLISPSTEGWDNRIIASGTLVANPDTLTGQIYDIWYSGYDGNTTWGVGRTEVFEEVVFLAEISDSLPNGPISWDFVSTRMIDGATGATWANLWPASGEAEHTVSMSGFFQPHTDIVWASNTQKFLLMEADFGYWFKLILSVEGSNINARWLYCPPGGATWTLYAITSKAMTGTWAAFTPMLVGASLGVKWVGTTYPTGHLDVVTGYSGGASSRTTGAWSLGTEQKFYNIKELRSVRILSTGSGSIHSTYFDSTFPGMGYENLTVNVAPIPATIPNPQYVMDRGLNVIHAASYRGTNPWEELRDVCEAELGCMVWDEDGVLHFYNRHHYTHPSRMTVVGELTDDTSLTGFTLNHDVADVKNIVNVKVRNQKRGQTNDIWKLTTDLWVPARQSITFDVETAGTLEAIDTIVSGIGSGGESRFRAAFLAGYDNGVPFTRQDGKTGGAGGAEGSIRVSVFPRGSSATITITNLSSQSIAMNDGSGKPYMFLWGRVFHDTRFSSGEGIVVTKEDSASVAVYGANEVELSLPYMTSATLGEALATYLICRFADGIDRLEDITIVGNPLFEIGDRVTVTFPRLGVGAQYWIESIGDNVAPEVGYTQNLSLSVADAGNWFILDSSILDGPDGLAF